MLYKELSIGEPERFNVVIETPKGSQVKYEYDENTDVIKQIWVFKNGFSFPYNYGFLPQTMADDRDTTDCFVITEQSFYPGVVVECKPLGIIEVIDRGATDNKIIAVPLNDPDYRKMESLDDLPFDYKNLFDSFFKEIAVQNGKDIELKGFGNKEAAIQYIEETHTTFQE